MGDLSGALYAWTGNQTELTIAAKSIAVFAKWIISALEFLSKFDHFLNICGKWSS